MRRCKHGQIGLMKYLHNELEAAQKSVFDDIVRFQTTPLKTSGYLESFMIVGIALKELGHSSAIVDAFIDKSTFSRIAFNSLKRASAHFILHEKPMPAFLKTWVVNYLHGTAEEPSNGRNGPNKSELEHALLLNCVDKVAAMTGLPIYPRETLGIENCALGMIAAVSKKIKENQGASVFPTTPKTMERRYLKAKKWAETKQ